MEQPQKVEPNPEEIEKYFKYYASITNAKKRYSEKYKEVINERARTLYHENPEYKERRKIQLREYARKRREAKLLSEKDDN